MSNLPAKYDLKWLFFSFRGRIARQSYGLAVLFQLAMLTLIVYQATQAGENEPRLAMVGFAFMILSVFIIWSVMALSVKRLHDLNLPIFAIVVLFVPMINWLAVFYLIFKPSYPDTNDHGPPPFLEPAK